MQYRRMALVFIVASSGVMGQTTEVSSDAQTRTEQQRIQTQRDAAQARHAAEEAACYKKFVVTACLENANAQYQATLADLRRQEISLRDDERKRKGVQALQRIEEKSSLAHQLNQAEQRAHAQEQQRSREQRSAKKLAERAQTQAAATQQPHVPQDKVDKAAASASNAAAVSENVQRYNDKIRDAKEHSAQQQKKRQERTKPRAKPLPVPL